MFINPTVFKRLCTQAYKKLGLHVEHSKNGYYAVAGDYWQIEVLDTYMTNKVKAILIDLIDRTVIENEKGECIPELPMGVTGGNSLIWANNIMAVQCYKRYIQYKGEQKIMELLGLSDMTWKFVDADKIAG